MPAHPSRERPQEPVHPTVLLQRLCAGDVAAGEALFEDLYAELHALAARMMDDERAGHTLQATALVHEAWMRLAPDAPLKVEDKDHLLRLSARAMRRLLVDHARRRDASKRGGGARATLLESTLPDAWKDPLELLALDEALLRLETEDPESARVVELRFFGGCSAEETARSLGWSVRQVEGAWVFARGWLRRELARGGGDD